MSSPPDLLALSVPGIRLAAVVGQVSVGIIGEIRGGLLGQLIRRIVGDGADGLRKTGTRPASGNLSAIAGRVIFVSQVP